MDADAGGSKGRLVLVVGPSGAGKDTLLAGARAALGPDPRIVFARREITRDADAGGEDHQPVAAEAFAARRDAYALAWEAHGLGYGIPASVVADLAAGHTVVANVSRTVVAGAARRFRVLVVEVTASPEILARRLAGRGREGVADQSRRLARHVALPAGVESVHIVNDGPAREGIAALVAAITRAAEPVLLR